MKKVNGWLYSIALLSAGSALVACGAQGDLSRMSTAQSADAQALAETEAQSQPATGDQPAAPQDEAKPTDDMFGENGLVTLDAQAYGKEMESENKDKPAPEDDLSAEDPKDADAKLDCDSIKTIATKHLIELNQNGYWHDFMRTPIWQTFSALAKKANENDCHPDNAADAEDSSKPADGAAKPAALLAYDCGVLTKKLKKAYGLVQESVEFQAVQKTVEWNRIRVDADLIKRAECNKK
jgi:predicted small lipoprotein YifL